MINLVAGWWGIISFVVNIFSISNNVFVYLFALGMPAVPKNAKVPQLDSGDIDRLAPHTERLLGMIEQNLDVEEICGRIAALSGTSPGQAMLYLQRGLSEDSFAFAGVSDKVLETTASQDVPAGEAPVTLPVGAETDQFESFGSTTYKPLPPTKPGKVPLVLGTILILAALLPGIYGGLQMAKYEAPVWPQEDLHSILKKGVANMQDDYKFKLKPHMAFYDLLVYEYEYYSSIKPEDSKVSFTYFPIVPENRGIIGSMQFKNVMIDGEFSIVPTNASHKKMALVKTYRFNQESELPEKNIRLTETEYTYTGTAENVLAHDSLKYIEKNMPGVDLNQLMVFSEGAHDYGQVVFVVLIALGAFVMLFGLVLLLIQASMSWTYTKKIRKMKSAGQLPMGPIG